jgi:hypothetical protein
MLVEGLLAVECSIIFVAFIHWIVSWRVEALIEGSLSVKCPIAPITHTQAHELVYRGAAAVPADCQKIDRKADSTGHIAQ